MDRIQDTNYFQLKTNVDAVIPIKYKDGQPSSFDLDVRNFTQTKILYRMLVTDNKLFDFTPMTGFLAKDEQITIKVTFCGQINDKKQLHYVCIRYIAHPPSFVNPLFDGIEMADSDDQWLALRHNPAGTGTRFTDEYCTSRYFLVDLIEEGIEKKDIWTEYLDDMKKLEQCQADINAGKYP